MINNGWIDSEGNIISVSGNIDESAKEYCTTYLNASVKNILDLYIIKYGDIKQLPKKLGVYSDFMVICLGFIKITNGKVCIPENKYEGYSLKYKKIYDRLGYKEMIYPKLYFNRDNGQFVSYNEKSMSFQKNKKVA